MDTRNFPVKRTAHVVITKMYNKKRVSCCRCIQCRRKNISAFPCKRNKSIVLHRVLPNSPKNVFLQRCYCGLRIRLQVKCRTARKGKPIIMFERGRVPYNMNITSLFFSMNNRSVMLQLFMLWKTNKVSYCIPLREVQKYQITSRSSEFFRKCFCCGRLLFWNRNSHEPNCQTYHMASTEIIHLTQTKYF